MSAGAAPFFVLVLYAIGLAIAYWVIRLAVRHAIQDADTRRQREGGPR